MILVVQIEPGPIPTLTASAPASARNFAAAPVAMLPTITCKSGYLALTSFNLSTTPLVWPWAVSMVITSTPACTSASTRCNVSAVTPTAAPTRKRPRSSLQAAG
ncbi:hypothetical protein D3C85_1388270 [compost metagenome]